MGPTHLSQVSSASARPTIWLDHDPLVEKVSINWIVYITKANIRTIYTGATFNFSSRFSDYVTYVVHKIYTPSRQLRLLQQPGWRTSFHIIYSSLRQDPLEFNFPAESVLMCLLGTLEVPKLKVPESTLPYWRAVQNIVRISSSLQSDAVTLEQAAAKAGVIQPKVILQMNRRISTSQFWKFRRAPPDVRCANCGIMDTKQWALLPNLDNPQQNDWTCDSCTMFRSRNGHIKNRPKALEEVRIARRNFSLASKRAGIKKYSSCGCHDNGTRIGRELDHHHHKYFYLTHNHRAIASRRFPKISSAWEQGWLW